MIQPFGKPPQFGNVQQLGQQNMDAALKAFGVVSKGTQAIAAETADFAKKSLEQGTSALERLAGVRSLDKAVEVQTDYAKIACETFVAQSAKMGQLYANLAQDMFRPYQGLGARPEQTLV